MDIVSDSSPVRVASWTNYGQGRSATGPRVNDTKEVVNNQSHRKAQKQAHELTVRHLPRTVILDMVIANKIDATMRSLVERQIAFLNISRNI